MIKYLVIILNSLFVYLAGFLDSQNPINISSNIPKTIEVGQEAQIEFKISKNSLLGFARFQIELPKGLVVSKNESIGADFTFNEGIAKWVWTKLPLENDIVIKATLKADTVSIGSKTITGKFSYVQNNEKQIVEMSPCEIKIQPNLLKPEEKLSDLSKVKSDSLNYLSNAEPSFNVVVERIIKKGIKENEFIVDLKIKKGTTKGFARYSDDLPDGISAKAISTDGSSFSVSDGKIKFVWVNVLPKEDLEVSYSIKSSDSKTINLKGEYSYLENNQSKKYELKSEEFIFSNNQFADDKVNIQKNSDDIKETKKIDNTKIDSVSKISKNLPNKTDVNETLIKQDGLIKFCVQIGAFTNSEVKAAILTKKFNLYQSINSEFAEGYSKFMVGSFPDYKNAREKRENLRNINKIKTAFVVAYNQTKRITVQEALMISNQKWYK
jgi:cell division septation protein DedD